MNITSLRIATRQSNMALWQANFIKQSLLELYPKLQIELLGITTKGDQIQDRSLADLGGKGLFVKALEVALLDGQANLAVHSMKDVPPELPPNLKIAAILKRDDPHDVFVSNQYASIETLPPGAVIGTCSVRRQAQLLAYNPTLTIKPLRGNVNTRLAKLDAGEYDAIILAAAGLQRLQLTHRIRQFLDIKMMLPSVAQGALGIEIVKHNNDTLLELLQELNDHQTSLCVTAERTLVQALNGNCHSPIGAYANIKNNILTIHGLVASIDGKQVVRATVNGSVRQAEQLALDCANKLLAQGASLILSII